MAFEKSNWKILFILLTVYFYFLPATVVKMIHKHVALHIQDKQPYCIFIAIFPVQK